MQPTVLCMMVTADRHAMVQRAIRSFRAQTYERKMLVILDTGVEPLFPMFTELPYNNVVYMRRRVEDFGQAHIGAMRNYVCAGAPDFQVICHFDSDDTSHPRRIEEQVALLQTGYDVVGYNQMLFWREDFPASWDIDQEGNRFGIPAEGEAYLYTYGASNYALCTSLCYWRAAWEKHGPFKDLVSQPRAESHYWEFLQKAKLGAVSSGDFPDYHPLTMKEPRMIASVHGGNTVQRDPAANVAENGADWKRVPQFDAWCAERMAL